MKKHNRHCHHYGIRHIIKTAKDADRTACPHSCRRVQPAYIAALAQNHTGAKEADTRYHLCSHTGDILYVVHTHQKAECRKRVGAQAHNQVGKYPRRMPCPLALQTNQGAE